MQQCTIQSIYVGHPANGLTKYWVAPTEIRALNSGGHTKKCDPRPSMVNNNGSPIYCKTSGPYHTINSLFGLRFNPLLSSLANASYATIYQETGSPWLLVLPHTTSAREKPLSSVLR